MTDQNSIRHKIRDLVMEEIEDENMTAEQVSKRIKEVVKQYNDLIDFANSSKCSVISDCETLQEVEEHLTQQFKILKLDVMYKAYKYHLQFL